ncbi:hypothetical protein NP493_8114g00003, partial [Ridgeia piscesae]
MPHTEVQLLPHSSRSQGCTALTLMARAMMTSGDRVVTSARHMEVGCHRVKARHQELAHDSKGGSQLAIGPHSQKGLLKNHGGAT